MHFKHLVSAVVTVGVALAQEDSGAMMNITSLLSSNANLSSLLSLVGNYPEIVSTLSSAQNITLFAPSNSALQALNSSGALMTASQQEGFVQALLQYHVLVGTFYAENITETPAFPATLLNNTMFSNVTGGQVVEVQAQDGDVYVFSGLKNNATVTEPNLMFSGGVAHVIDSVLSVPGNVSSVAQASNLTSLLGAVITTDLAETVSTTPDLTIFAPNNEAFASIANILANLSVEDAASVLQYHVVAGTVAYSSTLANGSVPSLAGPNLTITVSDDGVFVNQARVIVPDVLLANGVLHVIDSVLSPDANMAPNGTESSPVVAYPGASSGTMVPYTSGVPTPSTSMGNLMTTSVEANPSNTGAIGSNPAGNPSASSAGGAGGESSSSEAGAAMVTGAVGAAALFGGAALLGGW